MFYVYFFFKFQNNVPVLFIMYCKECVQIKFLKLFIAFIFSLLCSRDDDQSETFKVSGNLDYECK